MLLSLKKNIIYGPVSSRRLGRSLGINILPGDQKACPFNCLYCQYGWTDYHTALGSFLRFPGVEEVKIALEKALLELEPPVQFITFSGNGEPTLHPQFEAMVDAVIAVRNRLAPSAETAVLSNSALVGDKSIQKSLSKLDRIIMKLDCGSPSRFQKYNQPCSGIDLERITRGLEELEDVFIQTLFSAGENGNLEIQNIEEWIERLKRIGPKAVQLYTLDRDYPDKTLKPATEVELSRIRQKVRKSAIPAEIYCRLSGRSALS